MAGPRDSSEEAALWRRWRARAAGVAAAEEPDPLLLAAYAEDRLPPDMAESIEDWLAANPLASEDVLAARRARDAAFTVASADVVARASALVGTTDGVSVLPFRRPVTPPLRRWRNAVRWSGMAASILVASFVGFAMGNDAFVMLAGGANASLSQELLDPPTGLFNGLDEDSST